MIRNISRAVAVIVIAGMCACDDSKAPPSATGGGGGAKLADNPTSLLGKSAARARDVAQDPANVGAAQMGEAQAITGEAATLTVSGLTWRAPASWTSRPPANQFRTAEYLVAPDTGEGEALVVFSGGIGGDVNSNIERWRTQVVDDAGQPASASPKKQTIAGVTVTTIAMDGMLKASPMSGIPVDRPNSGFRGAVVEGPQGMVFIKFTGPKSIVEQNDAAWKAMIGGMTKQ